MALDRSAQVRVMMVAPALMPLFAEYLRAFGLDRPSTFTGKVADFGVQESVDLPGLDRSCFMIFETPSD